MATIGSINKTPTSGCDIEWQIPDFSLLPEEDGDVRYSSPLFSFAGVNWLLKMCPYGNGMDDSCIVFLKRVSAGSPVSLDFSLGLMTLDGRKDSAEHFTYIFQEPDEGFGFARCLSRSEILERRSELMSRGVLTVFCSLKCIGAIDDGNVRSLRQDFKRMLLEGNTHDLILKVEEKEFRAHRNILAARSRVFEFLLSPNMMGKTNGMIEVPDCDAHSIEQFLSYVYCGRVDTLDPSSMLRLYYVADKYDVEDLKEECSDFIKKSLSITNICNVIQLAVDHSDCSLMECAVEFFASNVLAILHSAEWLCFLKGNAKVANQVIIKVFDKFKM